jgi:nucleotide-binding universal stress UspA family protein
LITLKQILVATDFSEASEAALLYGKNFARVHRATLHVLHVIDDLMARAIAPVGRAPDLGALQEELDADAHDRVAELLTDEERSVLDAKAVVVTGRKPAEAIVSYAREHDIELIIIGTHGRKGLAHLVMGSVAEKIIAGAPCPVLTVKHPEREFIRPDALQAARTSSAVH